MAEEPKQEPRLTTLEAGDEFEDFPSTKWAAKTPNDNSNLWVKHWEDDDNYDDDFASTLRAELSKAKK